MLKIIVGVVNYHACIAESIVSRFQHCLHIDRIPTPVGCEEPFFARDASMHRKQAFFFAAQLGYDFACTQKAVISVVLDCLNFLLALGVPPRILAQ